MSWDVNYFMELFLAGLTRGSIYALIALGYTMVYGIIELINFAHGEIYMIGAFTALIVTGVLTLMGWNSVAILLIAAGVAVVYSSAYGYTIEKIAYKPLRNAPRLSALISAIGMSLFLQNYVLLAQTSDFLPFPALIPDFEWLRAVGTHRPLLTSRHFHHHRHRHGPADLSDQVHPDRQGHAGGFPGPGNGHAGGR